MLRRTYLIPALVAALAAVAFVVGTSSGSSHREAPLTALDPTAANRSGPKRIPYYACLAAQGIQPLNDGGKRSAGQRDEPFSAHFGETCDGVAIRNGTGNAGGGKDDLAGYSVHAIVLQVPES